MTIMECFCERVFFLALKINSQRTMRVSILVTEDVMVAGALGTAELFHKTNKIACGIPGQANEAIFDIEFVGISHRNVQLANGIMVYCDRLLEDLERTDLLILPSFEGNVFEAMERAKPFCLRFNGYTRRKHPSPAFAPGP